MKQAVTVQAQAAEARDQAASRRDEEQAAWNLRERSEQNRNFWRTTRDAGLAAFTVSTLTVVAVSLMVEIDDSRLQNGLFSDWQDRKNWLDGARGVVGWAAAAGVLSLFPLLWGEARQ